MSRDLFEHKAGTYEKDDNRVSNVENIANSIIASVSLDRSMHLMDFGSGTGLLLERIAPLVHKITAIDISKSMNAQLAKKQASLGCEIEILELDLASADITQKYDGIISSMTMHHVQDVGAMFLKFHSLLNDGGIIAISDLDSEDGSFHTEDTGVFHSGFDRESIAQAAKLAQFRDVKVVDASIVRKPHGEYPVFLLTAKK
jgi:cyclopropane fatty-acyl-phospholipid synthase-like methyltransferase